MEEVELSEREVAQRSTDGGGRGGLSGERRREKEGQGQGARGFIVAYDSTHRHRHIFPSQRAHVSTIVKEHV